jgi:hypothetical protein
LRNSGKNSTAGTVFTATVNNAARVIADETHREATEGEYSEFLAHQERERQQIAVMEQRRRKDVIVYMNAGDPNTVFAGVGVDQPKKAEVSEIAPAKK